MRWIWIDRILELRRGEKLVALKNISLAEDVLHDHFARRVDGSAKPQACQGDETCGDQTFGGQTSGGVGVQPVMPHSLIIEGMAQAAGILVGHAGDFKEKVILAKIARARFNLAAPPTAGYALRHTATLVRYDATGASTAGITERIDPATGQVQPLAEIELLFSHIDQNRSGLSFPQENFVFTGQFMRLIADAERATLEADRESDRKT